MLIPVILFHANFVCAHLIWTWHLSAHLAQNQSFFTQFFCDTPKTGTRQRREKDKEVYVLLKILLEINNNNKF